MKWNEMKEERHGQIPSLARSSHLTGSSEFSIQENSSTRFLPWYVFETGISKGFGGSVCLLALTDEDQPRCNVENTRRRHEPD